MSKLAYYVFRGFVTLISLVPYRLMYIKSDFFAFLFFHVVKYRKKVIINNLKSCFPNLSDKEILNLTKKFYKNLCDITLESIKGFTMSKKDLMERYTIVNPEVGNQFLAQERDIMYVGAHYCNWEWGTQIAPAFFTHYLIGIYKPLSNKYIDQYIKDHRMRRGTEFASIYNTAAIFKATRERPKAFVLVGDQSPSNEKKAIWIRFLNHDTACLHGIEMYSKMFNTPVVYIDVQRVKRGHYRLELDLLFEHPNEIEKIGVITEKYMRKVESLILKVPENWLWSHKRWKAEKPDNMVIESYL